MAKKAKKAKKTKKKTTRGASAKPSKSAAKKPKSAKKSTSSKPSKPTASKTPASARDDRPTDPAEPQAATNHDVVATNAILHELRAVGLAYPGTHIMAPWPGHHDLAVNNKTFAYLSLDNEPLYVGCKLPQSGQLALELPFCKPVPYGLGKYGWVAATFDGIPASNIDIDMLKAWLDESYRAQAPKKLVKQLK